MGRVGHLWFLFSAKAIQAAKAAAEGNNATTVCCFVDLLLPQYDIAAGRNVYDEVLAMEFCIGIALALDRDTQSVIYVKDDTSLTSIRRILESRRRSEELSISTMTTSTLRESATTNEEDDYEEIQVEIEIEDDTDDESEADLKSALTDKTTNGTGNQSTVDSASDPSSPNTDKDDFRQQLMSAWDNGDVVESPSLIQDKSAEEDTGSTEIPPGKERRTKTIIQRVKKDQRSQPPQVEATTSKNRYRLASMFGTSTISKGTNMPVDVLAALRIHARPGPEEDTMIILSAVSREESMALRSLVASFQSTKTIVLVNCRVEQLPRELSKVETVYSFLPLIAKSGDGANNNNNNNDDPRIVVLRQYPGKWQIHVDVDGTGFQLAKETSNDKFPNKRGPTMDWIANSLKNYLQSIRLKD